MIKDCFDVQIVMQNKTVALLFFFIVWNKLSELTIKSLGFYVLYTDKKQKYIKKVFFLLLMKF